jgi:hypothetical protein
MVTNIFTPHNSVPPALDLSFALTKALDPRITFTRNSSATFFDSAGLLQTAAADVARFDHDPITGESLGLLIEEARTNLLLNSATLSTQSVTLTAVTRTLSFYGTGSVTLSGVATGTLAGTGAFPSRVTLTFTPTAGSLTLTVTGTVEFAQLESGAFATSYIPTTGTAVARQADFASMTGTNFSSWYNAAEGTLFADSSTPFAVPSSHFMQVFHLNDGTTSNVVRIAYNTEAVATFGITQAGVSQVDYNPSGQTGIRRRVMAAAYKLNDCAASLGGAAAVADTSALIPVVSRADFGNRTPSASITSLNGHIHRVAYYSRRLSNAKLQVLSSPAGDRSIIRPVLRDSVIV